MHENMMKPFLWERNKMFTKQSSMAYTLGGRPLDLEQKEESHLIRL